jgi:hypothetical protein
LFHCYPQKRQLFVMQYLFPAEAADIHREETEQGKTQYIRKP